MRFQLLALATLATSALAAPAKELVSRAGDAQLPPYLLLYANQNGQDIGCINGFGNFTVSGSCYPFRVRYTSGNNGNDGVLRGYNECDLGSGPLDGALLDCSSGANGNLGQFWKTSDNYTSVDGPTGVIYSINAAPDPNNVNPVGIQYGSSLVIGGSGKYKQFKLRVQPTRG